MPFQHGKFGPSHSTRPGAIKSAGEKTPPASTPHEMEHGPAQSPHGNQGEEHVTKTHPGQTQPHPTTGVHAFHGHHTGGGKYQSHTHHDDGSVETQQHGNAAEMHSAMQDSLPNDQDGQNQGNDARNGGMDFSQDLGGIGGEQSAD